MKFHKIMLSTVHDTTHIRGGVARNGRLILKIGGKLASQIDGIGGTTHKLLLFATCN